MGVTLWYDVRDQDGQVLATFQPDSPNITYRLSDVGDHTIRIPLSDPELTYALFAPRRTDFRLKVSTDGGSTFQGIQGGICAPVSLKSREDFVTVRGFDWLAWLDQPYHFEGYSKAPATWVDTDIIKYWVNESQQTIIDDLCDGMYDGTSETININPVFSGAGWLSNIEVHYIQLGDTTTVLDLIRAVGSLAEPYGFDFTCADVTKQMFCYSPKRQQAESAMPFAIFAPSYENGLVDIDWVNEGPLATATVGMPTAALMKYYSYAAARAQFRKWLEILNFNETVRGDFMAQQITNDIGLLHQNPQKSNTITVLAELVDPFDPTVGFFNHCGRVVYVDSENMFAPYWFVDAAYVVTQQEITNSEGTWLCTFTLDQIY